MNFAKCKTVFIQRAYSEWLPSFCDARANDFREEGFNEKSLDRLTGFDAYWFMKAVDRELVVENGGFFTSPRSAAKEQIFWSGRNGTDCRDLYLWAEPIITLGAVARLVEEFQWPVDLVGTQSRYPWPFDLICYSVNSDEYWIACEVKKSACEIDKLIQLMNGYSQVDPNAEEPTRSVEKNAFRKVAGIRESWPEFFWALGPDGVSQVFKIEQLQCPGLFDMRPIAQNIGLEYQA